MKSIRGAFALLLAVTLLALVPAVTAAPAAASPADQYSGPYFGEDNLPLDCEGDVRVGELDLVTFGTDPGASGDNVCYHMRTGLNALDSPQVDVLILVPVSPTAERDMRIMRQSVEMWEGGIDYLAEQMGLSWLADGVNFHITVDYFDPSDQDGGEFTTYPIVDPELVVIATNPAGGAGIGIDPFTDSRPCNAFPVDNPLDFEAWENVPGFNAHHEERDSGTYVEDCQRETGGNGGGNTCFAINGAIDPVPGTLDIFGIYDLVSHEVGHCLTLGHVGDGAEGAWGKVATNDIMAYSPDPPGINKCVSTLDVEAFAVRMSRYLDTDGDKVPGEADDVLQSNDQRGQGGNPFQIQSPGDHLYASSTGDPMDCPQPDLGLVPGPRTDWTPQPASSEPTSRTPLLTITAPEDGAESDDGVFNVTGSVRRILPGEPISPNASVDDANDDATTPVTEITALGVKVGDTHLEATMGLMELTPPSDGASPTTYAVTVNGRTFHSFVYGVGFVQPRTWDEGAGAMMPEGTSSWDVASRTVRFNIPRSYLEDVGVEAPYFVGSTAAFGNPLLATTVDDQAPDDGGSIGVAELAFPGGSSVSSPLGGQIERKSFETEPDALGNRNTFYPEETSLGVTSEVGRDLSHRHPLTLPQPSKITFTLDWIDPVGGTDLDLYVTGAGVNSGNAGATPNLPGQTTETFVLDKVPAGALELRVEPYLVTGNPLDGVRYTLTADISPTGVVADGDSDNDGFLDDVDGCPTEAGIAPDGCPAPVDSDGDGISDDSDACPEESGSQSDGCPPASSGGAEEVQLWVGDEMKSNDPVDMSDGVDRFVLPVELPAGTHEVTVKWVDAEGVELDRASLTLTRTAPAVDPPPAGGGGTTPNSGGGGTAPSGPAPADRPAAGSRPPGATPAPAPSETSDETEKAAVLTRVQGNDRIATSVAASLAAFDDRSAEVAVLARSDAFADGLAGTSLAVAYGGPLLITPGGGLDARVADELWRVLPRGATVFVLGGAAALPLEMDGRLRNLGYNVKRLAGRDRFETAVLVARAQPRHETILVATGQNFADALAAGAAAAQARGTVVLTNDGALPKVTAEYLAENPGAEVFAIGGPAAGAVPDAYKVIGADRFETSVNVAGMFFEAPSLVGLTTGVGFPDALSGGALVGRFSAPLLLTAPDRLSPSVEDYLRRRVGSIDDLFVFGGSNAVAQPVVDEALQALRG